jgi:DNA sulfur modification protein DndD
VDTGLGMMSGTVKKRTFESLCERSAQLVMFLTPAEIGGIEKEIKIYAGKEYTFSSANHWPQMLVNKPPTPWKETLCCSCGCDEFCNLCEKR